MKGPSPALSQTTQSPGDAKSPSPRSRRARSPAHDVRHYRNGARAGSRRSTDAAQRSSMRSSSCSSRPCHPRSRARALRIPDVIYEFYAQRSFQPGVEQCTHGERTAARAERQRGRTGSIRADYHLAVLNSWRCRRRGRRVRTRGIRDPAHRCVAAASPNDLSIGKSGSRPRSIHTGTTRALTNGVDIAQRIEYLRSRARTSMRRSKT